MFPDLPLATLVAGAALGVSLAAPPGPVTALMLHELPRRGRGAAFRVGLGAMTADMGFAVLASAGAIALLAARPTWLGALSVAGAGMLAFYARGAWRSARSPAAASEHLRPATYVTGFLAAATSPFNLAWWVGPGTALLAAEGSWLAVGLFLGILGWLVLFVEGLARLGARARRVQQGMAYASAAILAVFAVWAAWRGLALLGLA